MNNRPLSPEKKAAAKQVVRDKTLPMRIRYVAEWCLAVLFALGVVVLIGYGGIHLWTLVYAKEKADRIEQRLQDHIQETQRDAEP